MDDYARLKERIALRTDTLRDAVERLQDQGLVNEEQARLWHEHLDLVSGALNDPLIRIAVVGSVKSGKSTLINALVGRDLLKRGAGIITSFITRIRCNSREGGWVELKSWKEINREVSRAVALLPWSDGQETRRDSWDLQKASHRKLLRRLLEDSQKEWRSGGGALDANFLLLNAFLDGYPEIKELVGDQVNRLLFDGVSLEQHQKFVGRESQAVYLKDLELHYPVPWLGKEVELADCQGSDSPNPLHLALLQQYLLKSHLIVYVISSRTGIREADLKLLQFIQTLRMLPHTLFVFNLDLDNHPSGEDIEDSIQRIHTELQWTVPNPQIFAASALYHLIEAQGDEASARERRRFEAWNEDGFGKEISRSGFEGLKEALASRIGRQRGRVLFGSGLNRLGVVAQALSETSRTQFQLLDQNLEQLKTSAERLKERQQALLGTLGTLENAISGLRDTLRKDVDHAVGSFFDLDYGAVIQETLQMIEHYPVDPTYLNDLNDPTKVLKQLHRFYLEFRKSLSSFLVEKVNLHTVRFAKEQEAFLRDRLQQSSRAFWALFQTAMEEYHQELARYGVKVRSYEMNLDEEWSDWHEIVPPAFSGFVDEHAVGRSVLLMKFGIGRIGRLLSSLKARLGRKNLPSPRDSEEGDTLREAIDLVKSETRSEILYAFRDYRQNFRYQYLYRLLDAGTAHLLQEFRIRARMAQTNFQDLLRRGAQEESKRIQDVDTLREISRIAEAQLEAIEELRRALNLEWFGEEQEASRPASEQSG